MAALLSLALLVGAFPVSAFSATNHGGAGRTRLTGLCAHHTEHDASCGYSEGTEGTPCTHEHGDDCWKLAKKCTHHHTDECYPETDEVDEATGSTVRKPKPTECIHECSEEEGCYSLILNCKHRHDEDCGYSAGTRGTDCGYVCEICNQEESTEPEEEACICKKACTEKKINRRCPVCREADAAPELCEGAEEEASPSDAVPPILEADIRNMIRAFSWPEEFCITQDENGAYTLSVAAAELNQTDLKEKLPSYILVGESDITDASDEEETAAADSATASGARKKTVRRAFSAEKTATESEAADPETGTEKGKKQVPIEWNLEEIPEKPDTDAQAVTYLIEGESAETKQGGVDRETSDTEVIVRRASYRITFRPKTAGLEEGVSNELTVKPYTGTRFQYWEKYKQYEVETVSPANATINLFDYWVTWKDDQDHILHTKQINGVPEQLTKGINKDHELIFGRNETGAYDNYFSSNSVNWNWNLNTEELSGNDQHGPYPNMVKRVLDENGSPVMAVGTEQALDYLFNDEAVDGKEVYKDVKGLLQRDDDGTYYYRSRENFAAYQEEANTFHVYEEPGVWTAFRGVNNYCGQFFPFNSPAYAFEIKDGRLEQRDGKYTLWGDPNYYLYNSINGYDDKGNVTYRTGAESAEDGAENINHFFGLTLGVDFYQPDGGKLPAKEGQTAADERKDMVFDFSGDDDVWIYIDGILVANLGGIHPELKVNINFADGSIWIERTKEAGGNWQGFKTSLREQFAAALEEMETAGTLDAFLAEQGCETREEYLDTYFRKTGTGSSEAGTFRSGTRHSLKMFYMERGNVDSNLNLSYNLVPIVADEVVKLDQDNRTIGGVAFELYKADEDYNYTDKKDNEEENDLLLGSVKTDQDGTLILAKDNIPLDFRKFAEDDETLVTHYVLKEVSHAEVGYRPIGEIHLQYDKENHILDIANSWETGAVGNFTANIYQNIAGVNAGTSGTEKISDEELKKGIILAVPMINIADQDDTDYYDAQNWRPMWGANLEGFHPVEAVALSDHDGDAGLAQRQAVIEAALYQLYYSMSADTSGKYKSWYLEWNDLEARCQGVLEDLPGTPDRYYRGDSQGRHDLAMAYYFFSGDALGTNADADAYVKMDALLWKVQEKINRGSDRDSAIFAVISELAQDTDGVKLVDLKNFRRVYGSHIYVPNIVNALAVHKINEWNQSQAGAEFTLYEDQTCTMQLASGTTDENGLMVFSAQEETRTDSNGELVPGSAHAVLETGKTYYLKETRAPENYEPNPTVVPVMVTDQGVYAYAGETKINDEGQDLNEDNVSVLKGVGKLVGTMTRFATDDGVNVTLRDIQASLETGELTTDSEGSRFTFTPATPSAAAPSLASPSTAPRVLHYNEEGALADYALHKGEDGDSFFKVFSGWARVAVKQVIIDDDDHKTSAQLKNLNEELQEPDLTPLFTGSTTVEVQNYPQNWKTGNLKLSKTVLGEGADTDREFIFQLVFEKDKVPDKLYGDVALKDGQATVKLKHGDSVMLTGLPAGVSYIVTEEAVGGYETTVAVSVTGADGSVLTEAATASGTQTNGRVPEDQTAELSFTNTKNGAVDPPGPGPDPDPDPTPDPKPDPETGALLIRKTVSGNAASVDQEFRFTLTLRDAEGALLSGSYPYTGAKSGTVSGGMAEFQLRHGDEITVEGIPAGTLYSVAEAEYADYTVTKSGDTGTIEANVTAEALFQNEKSSGGGGSGGGGGGGSDNPGRPVTPVTPATPDDPLTPVPVTPDDPLTTIVVTEEVPLALSPSAPKDEVPKTGDTTQLGLYLAVLGASVLGMLAVAYAIRQEAERERRRARNRRRHRG